MKQISLTMIMVFMVFMLLISCKEKPPKTTSIDNQLLNNNWTSEIQLDNDFKWLANPENNEGVEKMRNEIALADLESVKDYKTLASKLNDHKNYIIKECTMEGPSHDNLHIFLHPLIDKIEALGKINTAQEGAQLTKSIEENLKAYSDYFK